MKLRLKASVSSNSPDAVGRFLVGKFAARSVRRDGSDWIVRGEVEGTSARDANRDLLSELQRVERKTRLRAEWTAGGGKDSQNRVAPLFSPTTYVFIYISVEQLNLQSRSAAAAIFSARFGLLLRVGRLIGRWRLERHVGR
jgi:hypothetical protein